MKQMAAGEFKARCLSVMAKVRTTREPVLITKRGRPLVKVVPAGEAPEFLGRFQNVVKIQDDIESPVEPVEAWEVLR